MEKTIINPLVINQKAAQLNRDLAPLGEQIGKLIQQYNSELAGHGVDVTLECNWRASTSCGDFIGRWDLTKVQFVVKPMPLPRARLG